MNQVETRPRVSQQEAVGWLGTLDINALGLSADAASRARLGPHAGYRRPHNVVLLRDGWQDASTQRRLDHLSNDVRIVGLGADVDSDQVYSALQSLSQQGLWVDGLVTSDLDRLQLDPARLASSGLRRLRGAHCESFLQAARSLRGQHKWETALTWFRRVAQAGLHLHVDFLYGEDETVDVLAHRLLEVRTLQDETHAVDALVPIPHNARRAAETPTEITFGFDDMRLLATARLVLDNVQHIQVPWLPFGLKAAQMGLVFGGDDLGPWCLDPGVTEEAHVATLLALREEEVIMAITDSGRQPVLWKGQE